MSPGKGSRMERSKRRTLGQEGPCQGHQSKMSFQREEGVDMWGGV